MAGYSPLYITGPTTGLVKNREEFILPDDAYPRLQNAYVWRERILRKKGYQLLGRLQRSVTASDFSTASPMIFNLFTFLSVTDSLATIVPGSIQITLDGETYTDNGNGTLTGVPTGNATVNYATGDITINTAQGAGNPLSITLSYNPNLPVMGIRQREINGNSLNQTVFFDQVYAYRFNSSTNSFQEFIPGTTWNAHGGNISAVDFFWSTNYWVSSTTLPGTATPFFTTANQKLFWVTNDTGQFGANADPIRITDGVTWVNFSPPNFGQLDATNYVVQCLSMLPFRGRMLMFNTWEGTSYASAQNFSNRIRWSTIGNPFVPFSAGPPATGSWRDDIRGQGGFLDIPTNEDIISVGFVRDNLVIYCERSTWQLRYTGRSIAPFQIEKVNTELGSNSPFSAIQFDTSLVGIGDKGIVECDSYKSERIDIKIPDFVFDFQNMNNGPVRVQGVRDFINRLAFWTVPILSEYDARISSSARIFPNQRLVYNYENDSWALFDDSLTALGTFYPQTNRTWLNTHLPWVRCNFSWTSSQNAGIPAIVGGNQQGFIEYLNAVTVNDASLYIENITANTTNPTVITSPNHNLVTTTGDNVKHIISISGIPTGTPFDNLNGGIFGLVVIDQNSFSLWKYDPVTKQFSTPQLDVPSGDYIGGGLITLRENFFIVSKKFNFIDKGQNIQVGYLDILMSATERDNPGAISLNVFLDYNEDEASNTTPQNEINNASPTSEPDTFFNSIIPTTPSTLNGIGGSKFWQRVYCATRANFITLEYTFSNAQLVGEEQNKEVQIDAQILWLRTAGRITQI